MKYTLEQTDHFKLTMKRCLKNYLVFVFVVKNHTYDGMFFLVVWLLN